MAPVVLSVNLGCFSVAENAHSVNADKKETSMSKPTRISLAVLVSLIVIIAIFSTVQGASLSARQDRAGSHLVSGPQVDLNHYREAAPAPAASEFRSPPAEAGGGHECESENQTSPLD